MSDDKEIRFTEKKVDESWKEQIVREKDPVNLAQNAASSPARPQPVTSKAFINLLTSLGYQALMHLGEMPDANPEEISLPAAKEIIELLITVKQKTEGNRSADESKVLEQLIPELQLKFAQKA